MKIINFCLNPSLITIDIISPKKPTTLYNIPPNLLRRKENQIIVISLIYIVSSIQSKTMLQMLAIYIFKQFQCYIVTFLPISTLPLADLQARDERLDSSLLDRHGFSSLAQDYLIGVRT